MPTVEIARFSSRRPSRPLARSRMARWAPQRHSRPAAGL